MPNLDIRYCVLRERDVDTLWITVMSREQVDEGSPPSSNAVIVIRETFDEGRPSGYSYFWEAGGAGDERYSL